MKKFTLTKVLLGCCAILFSAGLIAQTTISGKVTDDNEPLIGANVVIEGTTEGTITDFDGNFEINTSQTPPFNLEVSYTGYSSKTVAVTSADQDLNIVLMEGVLLGEDVIISASRRREKVQEAPASVSVIGARKLEASPNVTDVTRNLVNTAGVQVQQQSANRINISMRGSSGLFGTSVFPILDYRSLIGPGVGTFQSDQAGLSQLDIERIEVVRGAGSALYGPGVTQGVVHFISKSPIDDPCTSIELIGGELSTFGGAIRHATKVSDKFGFKINAQYRQGNEFTLNPEDSIGAAQIAKFVPANPFTGERGIYQPNVVNGIVDQFSPGTLLIGLDELDSDGDGNPMAPNWYNASVNATLEFRPADQTTINVSGGYNEAKSVFYNEQGEGLSDAREYWAQARGQFGGLFAQVFGVINDGGTEENPTFLYQTGLRTPVGRTQLEAQLQYNFDTPGFLDANWTVGSDYRFAGQDTENLVYGRNEDDDDFSVIGGYAQGKFALADKLDLVLAARYDQFNFIDEGAFAPRAALVYKAAPNHTFRASFNRATSTVSNLQLNIDFPLSTVVPGSFDVWLYGNKTTQTFGDNPTIDWFNGLIPSIPVGTPGAGLPLGALLAQEAAPGVSVNDFLIGQILAGVLADPTTAPLAPAVEAALGTINPASIGFGGSLSDGFNIFDGSPLGLVDAPISQIAISDTWEVGYKGLIGNKLGVTLDLYRVTEDGNSQFTAISPAYRLDGIQGLSGDLGANAEGLFTPAFISALQQAGFDEATATGIAGQLAPLVNGAYQSGGNLVLNTPSGDFGGLTLTQVLEALPFHATTQTEQTPDNGVTHLAAGYRTFNERTYYGWDLGLEYYVDENLTFFGNYSGVDKVAFMQSVRGKDENNLLPSHLNIPQHKFRLGANYTPVTGFRANIAFQHDQSFNPIAGQFSGPTGDRNLVDAGFGYKFDNGLTLNVTAQNLFNNEYRYYNNMPLIGRRVLATARYDLCAEGPSDMDGDGVKDKKDMCPDVPGLKEFNGCPDSDGDGIKDSDDNCPLVAGTINGCPDTDGDGLIDKEDGCPEMAGDLNGCPDADGDGVADKDDDCPNAAGNLNGCPDGDGDGVADKNDGCPTVAGTVNGCPDSDGDGVADKDDKCPNEAGDAADGCMSMKDADGDGVADDKDACPNAKGSINGCPDSDKDGVADKDDKCPNRAGMKSLSGCPEVKAEAKKVFDRALSGIQFRSGSTVIKSESFAVLNDVVEVMKADPSLKVKVVGHTDSQGNDQKNLELSSKRAQTVVKYLVSKGVNSANLSSLGQGEYQPIADNNTAAGRKQNRRVEFRASY